MNNLNKRVNQLKTIEEQIHILLLENPELGELKDVDLFLTYLKRFQGKIIFPDTVSTIKWVFGKSGSSFKSVIRARSRLGFPKREKEASNDMENAYFVKSISGNQQKLI